MTSLVTAALTAFFGVVIFVLSQITQRFLIEPIQEQRKIIGEIVYALTFYAGMHPISGRPAEQFNQGSDALRQLAGRLRASYYTIPFYSSLAKMHMVMPRQAIDDASRGLVGWSNSLPAGDHSAIEHQKWIADALHVWIKER